MSTLIHAWFGSQETVKLLKVIYCFIKHLYLVELWK